MVNAIQLKERIATAGEFAPEERDFLVNAVDLAIGKRESDTLKPPSLLDLQRRIEQSLSFTAAERKLILDALLLGTRRSTEYNYPVAFRPGSSPNATAAWAILDQLPPGALTDGQRFMLGGLFAGALDRMFKTGREYESKHRR